MYSILDLVHLWFSASASFSIIEKKQRLVKGLKLVPLPHLSLPSTVKAGRHLRSMCEQQLQY
jgi:hypothetical protein